MMVRRIITATIYTTAQACRQSVPGRGEAFVEKLSTSRPLSSAAPSGRIYRIGAIPVRGFTSFTPATFRDPSGVGYLPEILPYQSLHFRICLPTVGAYGAIRNIMERYFHHILSVPPPRQGGYIGLGCPVRGFTSFTPGYVP
jgi:hypothetical protein